MWFYLISFIEFCKTAFFVLGYISNNSLFPEPLSQEEEKKYLERYMNGDEEARNVLIERNLRLVAHICKKYNIPNLELDDLISIGTIGLMKSVKESSGYYTILDDMNPDWWVIRRSELYPMEEAPFGPLTIRLPAKNDEMLRRQYGDYMQYPPEEERGGHDIVKLVFPAGWE